MILGLQNGECLFMKLLYLPFQRQLIWCDIDDCTWWIILWWMLSFMEVVCILLFGGGLDFVL